MKIVKEFSRFAHEYNTHNIIQSEVAKKLVSMLEKDSYSKVLDLGAGSGAVYNNMINQNIRVDEFIAFDFSKEMLSLHPKKIEIQTVCSDFNNSNSFKEYRDNEFSILISSSALQWSENLPSVLDTISRLAPMHYFAFFTAKTFSTLHEVAAINSPIYSKKSILDALNDSYSIETMEEVEYHLDFNSVLEMFRYIKRSGVSGGSGVLSYREMKSIMKNYPLDYLEFEVLFIKAEPK
jgi:malonyl-CoA O-methyltransferase